MNIPRRHHSGKLLASPDEIKTFIKTIETEILNILFVYYIFQCGLSQRLIGLLSKFNYKIYNSGDQNFITCDNPVAICNPLNPYKCGLNIHGTEKSHSL